MVCIKETLFPTARVTLQYKRLHSTYTAGESATVAAAAASSSSSSSMASAADGVGEEIGESATSSAIATSSVEKATC